MKKMNLRSVVTMMVIFFAVATSSCQKEDHVTPNAPGGPNVPVAPPAAPAVSLKPRSIVTTENGIIVRKELYEYDAQGKLSTYESLAANSTSDSVLIRSNNVAFKSPGAATINQSLVFNADKTFKSLFTPNDQIDFVNNGVKLGSMQRLGLNNNIQTVGQFQYINNNLSTMGAEVRIDINYHENLPYQKGINELPVGFKPLKYFKIMEMENVTTTTLYSKLIRQVIIIGGSTRELHEYAYTFDANNRVTQIQDTQTFITASSSTQKVVIKSISYPQN